MNVLVVMFFCMISSIVVIFVIFAIIDHVRYKEHKYYKLNGKKFYQVISNRVNYGEWQIYCLLKKNYPNSFFLSNLYLENEQHDDSTEIDLVMVHESGIYVIESKNYIGGIIGNGYKKIWKKVIRNRPQYRMLNPVWQNRKHIQFLCNALDHLFYPDEIYSYIVFGNRSTLKKIKYNCNHTRVVKLNQLLSSIGYDVLHSEYKLEYEEMYQIYKTLEKYTKPSRKLVKEHHVRVSKKLINKNYHYPTE